MNQSDLQKVRDRKCAAAGDLQGPLTSEGERKIQFERMVQYLWKYMYLISYQDDKIDTSNVSLLNMKPAGGQLAQH